MISTSDYNFIRSHLASAQDQHYKVLERLSDMRNRMIHVESLVGNASPERLSDWIDYTYNFIVTWEINNRLMDKMELALQNHILAHWD